jgi:hypothetical protein
MDKSYKAGEKEKKRLMEATPDHKIKRVKKPDRTLPEKIPVKHTHRGEKAGLLAQPMPLDPEERHKLRLANQKAGMPDLLTDDLPLQMDKSKRKEELRKMWFAKYMPKTGK